MAATSAIPISVPVDHRTALVLGVRELRAAGAFTAARVPTGRQPLGKRTIRFR
jgi:hypothetical protein